MSGYATYSLADLESQVIDAAKEKAREIIKSALAEADGIRAKAKAEGVSAAFNEEKHRIEQETIGVSSTLKSILDSISKEKRTIENNAERGLIKLAVAIAEKVIKKETSKVAGNEIVVNNLRNSIELVTKRNDIEVIINKSDYDVVEKYLPQLKKDFTDIANITLVADNTLSKGGCIVKTKEGAIDADVKTQLDEIERQLLSKG